MRSLLSAKFGRPTLLGNDANAAALTGEAAVGR